MKEVVKEVLAHPIATLIVVGAVGSAIAGIVSAAKGTTEPIVRVSIMKEATSDGEQIQA